MKGTYSEIFDNYVYIYEYVFRIRVLTMRFLETLVICQTSKSEMSDLSKITYEMSLNHIARDHRFISYRQLETEAAHSFKSLMDHLSSSHTTLLHLISTLTAVARIARARPEFMSQVSKLHPYFFGKLHHGCFSDG